MIDLLDIGIAVLALVFLTTATMIGVVIRLELRSWRARRNALRRRGFLPMDHNDENGTARELVAGATTHRR